MFYSQQQEDKILFEKYLNYKNGFFIELGAMDGVQYSNTLFFEQNLNWKGVLIEPTNQFINLIKNRPNCYNFNYAVSNIEGEVEFLGDGALGGIPDLMSDWHKYGWKLDKLESYKVKSKPISKIIKDINIERVDLFSIDVEGGEIMVLETFDWTIPVYLILIEGNYTASEKDKNDWITKPNVNNILVNNEYINRINKCTDILTKNGFEFIEKIGCNEVWINKKNKLL